MQKVIDKIKEAEKYSVTENKVVYFYFDIDSDSYWYEDYDGNSSEISVCGFDFYKAKNDFEEKKEGIIHFRIKPEGGKSFLLLYIYDIKNNSFYTFFSNPFSDMEILKGEVEFENL